MFTGIIEHTGTIEALDLKDDGGRVTIHAPTVTPSLAVSNSIAVNGCCLTIVDLHNGRLSAEFGGHFVLGHVDTVSRVAHLTPEGENWWFGVQVPAEFTRYVVPKGSITIDGISLTVARWQDDIAEVAVIPYTYENTNIRDRKPGDAVNLEGDVLGKYVERYLEARNLTAPVESQLTVARLVEEGF